MSYRLADWNRFPAAKAWLDQHNIQPVARDRFEEFMKQSPVAAKVQSDAVREALFKQFQTWQADQSARAAQAQARPEKPEKKER